MPLRLSAGGPSADAAAGDQDLGSTQIGHGAVSSAAAWRSIEELRRRLARIPDLPPYRGRPAVENTGLLWWFLRDRRLNVAEATEKLAQCLRWRAEFRVERLGPELFAKEMRARKGYLHQHPDIAGRPVLVAVARRHNVMQRRLEDSCRMCAWMLESAMDLLGTAEPTLEGEQAPSHPAPIEQALGIFDLRGFSPLQADLEVALFLVDVLYKYYPGRTGRVLLVGAPELFRSFWQGVRPLLGHYASLADFVTVDDVRTKYFAPGLAPPGFGAEGVAAGERPSRDSRSRPATATSLSAGAPGGGRQRLRKPLVLTGATLAIAAATAATAGFALARRRLRRLPAQAHAGRTRRASLPGLGSHHIGGDDGGPVDAATAWRCMERLREQLLRLGPSLPPWRGRPAAEDDGLLWWFLRDRRLDVGEAVKKLQHCLLWRRAFRVDYLGPENFSRELRARKAYLHEHPDVMGRPVLVVIAQRHNLMERKLDECCRMCAWFMERTMDRLVTSEPPRLPEKIGSEDKLQAEDGVEQALGIIDLRGFSPLQADLEFAGFLVQALHDYYPGRFARILLVDAPEVFRSFWENVRPLLHRYAYLADFVSAEEVRSRYFAPGTYPPELERR